MPLEGTIPLAELAAQTPLDGTNLARLLRYAMTHQVFREPAPGQIGHTAASRLLAEDGQLAAWVGFNTEDIYPASARVVEALERWPEASSSTRTGFNLAFGTAGREPMFATFARDPPRARRMARAMHSLTGGAGYEVRHLVDGYAAVLGAVDARGGTLVDVGGSTGFVCVQLARRYRAMRFVVQDTAATVASAPRPLVADDPQAAARIALRRHDFFTEQPVRGADVYFLRWILHNYPTPDALRILRALVPALRPGARVLINDHCLRPPGHEDRWDDRLMRGMDLVMLTLLNAQERGEDEFRALFAAAADGFVFQVGRCSFLLLPLMLLPCCFFFRLARR